MRQVMSSKIGCILPFYLIFILLEVNFIQYIIRLHLLFILIMYVKFQKD